MNRWLGLGLLVIATGAWLLRWPQLAERPMHNDEAVNGIKFQALWERGVYTYDPNEHHGPPLYYPTLPFLWLTPGPASQRLPETPLRVVPLFFGVMLIPLLWPIRGALGPGGTLGAALLI